MCAWFTITYMKFLPHSVYQKLFKSVNFLLSYSKNKMWTLSAAQCIFYIYSLGKQHYKQAV